ncbi:MAG: AMP nucleosidase [Rickettsiales bacterium]|nr:AMP nucleosidase [Rickettsiales bacterium]|tara:strand:- start:2057 stop:3601 length:1545 start_codon:yes stop_codon:yes gene_type:complete
MVKKKIKPIEQGTDPKLFDDAVSAFHYVEQIYNRNTNYLQECFKEFGNGVDFEERVHAYYPYIQVTTTSTEYDQDNRLSYGYVYKPGTYRTTVTRPDLYKEYYINQISHLMSSHKVKIEVGVSDTHIPIHFSLGETIHLEGELTPDRLKYLPEYFDLPDLVYMDDSIANGTFYPKEGDPNPLALFTAPRVDISLQRLKHYTATKAEHFQGFVLYTNYQFYVDEFIRLGRELMLHTDDAEEAMYRQQFTEFVEPGDFITPNQNMVDEDGNLVNKNAGAHGTKAARMPQMPAYHLKRADGLGITLVNIGVGPSNAKTITDHIAVLRPHAWLMLGHCAGLRNSQKMGDYVLAHGYMRLDHVLDNDLSPQIPLPPLAEVQVALEQAVGRVTGLRGYELKKIMRTGTVATIDDRNWELQDYRIPLQILSQSRAVAMDMESATIAANGFRFRVPYGTLLCVSDKPLHGQLKLPGMADTFYRERVDQHLQIGMMALELMRDNGLERLHSRKLRSVGEVAFR